MNDKEGEAERNEGGVRIGYDAKQAHVWNWERISLLEHEVEDHWIAEVEEAYPSYSSWNPFQSLWGVSFSEKWGKFICVSSCPFTNFDAVLIDSG